MQHRGRVLRIEPRAHSPHRRGRPRPTLQAVRAQLSTAPRVLTALPLAIDPAEVLRFQGYKTSVETPDPEVRALFDEALALERALMEPRAVVRWLPVQRQGADSIEAGDTTLAIPAPARPAA